MINSINRPPKPSPQAPAPENETAWRLVDMTNQTCLVALDKTISAIRRSQISGRAAAAARTSSILERIMRATYELGLTIPLRGK